MKHLRRTRGSRLALGVGLVAASVLALAACSASGTSTSVPGINVATAGTALTGTTLEKALSPALLSLPLTNEHGKTLTLGSLSGKTIVLVPFLTTLGVPKVSQRIWPWPSITRQFPAITSLVDASRS